MAKLCYKYHHLAIFIAKLCYKYHHLAIFIVVF